MDDPLNVAMLDDLRLILGVKLNLVLLVNLMSPKRCNTYGIAREQLKKSCFKEAKKESPLIQDRVYVKQILKR